MFYYSKCVNFFVLYGPIENIITRTKEKKSVNINIYYLHSVFILKNKQFIYV